MNAKGPHHPNVTVIIPNFNSSSTIIECIQSVIKQTYKNFEILVIDDCSTDESLMLVEKISDPRVKTVKLEKNLGAAVARNIGMDQANGKFIAFLDSDDKWDVNKLHRQVHFMESNDYYFTYTAYQRHLIRNGNKVKVLNTVISQIDYKTLLTNTQIYTSTVMLRSEKIGDARMPLLRRRQDLAFWLHLLKTYGDAYGLNEPLMLYDDIKKGLSKSIYQSVKSTFYVYRKVENISVTRSLILLCSYLIHAVCKRLKV